MKKIMTLSFLIIIFCLFISQDLHSQQSGWYSQNSIQNNWYGVTSSNNQIAWIVGENSLIRKTTDGGNNWFPQTSAASVRLYFGLALSNDLCWVLGYGGVMTKTTNGGTNWVLNCTGGGSSDIKFLNSNTGWTAGGAVILKTTNSGDNWTLLSYSSQKVWNSLCFIDSQTVFVVGGDWTAYPPNYYYYFRRIDKSINGGIDWTIKFRASSSGSYKYLNSICFINTDTGFCIGAGNHFLRTVDGGENWTEQVLGLDSDLRMILFKNQYTGWIVGSGGNILKSTNSGLNWYSQNSGTTQDLNKICFNDLMTGWICGMNGTILHTTDGGGLMAPLLIQNVKKTIPENYILSQNYPNPFNPSTTIGFDLPEKSFVTLTVYDLTGRVAEELVNSDLNAGSYDINFDGTCFASGVYYYKLNAGSYTCTKKMILVK